MPSILTRQEQATAQFAHDKVRQVGGQGEMPKEYKSHVRKLPMMVKQNGLIAALLFVEKNRGKRAYELLGDHMTAWLTRTGNDNPAPVAIPGTGPLPQRLTVLAVPDYIAVTRDAQRALLWLKRYSEAMIGG